MLKKLYIKHSVNPIEKDKSILTTEFLLKAVANTLPTKIKHPRYSIGMY